MAYHFLCFALFVLFCFILLCLLLSEASRGWRCSGGVLVRHLRPDCLDIRKHDTGCDSRPDPARLHLGCRPARAGTRQSLFHRCQSVANPDCGWCTDWTSIRISMLQYVVLLYCILYVLLLPI